MMGILNCLKKKKKNRKPVICNWPSDGGPDDRIYEKDTYDYYVTHKANQPRQTSFDDDSSMTP